VGVVIPPIAAPVGPMQGDIRNHAPPDQLTVNECRDQAQPFRELQLVRQRELQFACELGVFAPLCLLDRIPERGAVLHPCGGVGRGQNGGVLDTLSPAVVMHLACPGILDPAAGPVGGGGGRRASFAPGEDLGGQAVNGH
jgi:hypothetical protein